jgi:hypothetical protein
LHSYPVGVTGGAHQHAILQGGGSTGAMFDDVMNRCLAKWYASVWKLVIRMLTLAAIPIPNYLALKRIKEPIRIKPHDLDTWVNFRK